MARRRLHTMVLVLAGLLAAMPAGTAAAKPSHDRTMRAALLRVDDLTGNWASIPPTDADDRLMCGVDPTGVLTSVSFEDAIYSSAGGYGAYVYTAVARFRAGTASSTMRAAARSPGCTEKTPDGRTVVTRVKALRVPSVGDESVAFRVTQTGGVLSPFVFDTILVRRGDLVGTIATFALIGRPPSPVPLARKIGERLAELS